jgi:hypothetical protein
MRHAFALLLLAAACGGSTPTPTPASQAEPASVAAAVTTPAAPAPTPAEPSPAPTPEPEPTPTAARFEPEPPPTPARWQDLLPAGTKPRTEATLANLDRLPKLTADHRQRLREHGLFITPQPPPSRASAAAARESRRARHLFQVYERNDYVRFPSYVTVDVAIDLTHQYFDGILREVEAEHLVPRLTIALQGLVAQAIALRDGAKTDAGRRAAAAAASYWGTALRLLEQPAADDAPEVEVVLPWWWDDPEMREEIDPGWAPPVTPPPAVTRFDPALEAEVTAAVSTVHAAAGIERFEAWGQTLDLTLTRPRSHYVGSGRMQRYFRAMSLLGLSAFPVSGPDARPAMLVALALSTEGDAAATRALDEVLKVTHFLVGEPPTAGVTRAAAVAREAAGAAADLDALVTAATLDAIVARWKALPTNPLTPEMGPAVQPVGQRAFVDAVAMAALLPVVRGLTVDREPLVTRAMGPVGAAAMLGSDRARELVLEEAGPQRAAVEAGIAEGRARVGTGLRRDDSYHRTLGALAELLAADPYYLEPRAHELRMLGAFAAGWAELRHDTLLYAQQMGAECDAEELPPPHGWVEPYPVLYARLRAMVEGMQARLVEAGIDVHRRSRATGDYDPVFQPIAEKTKAVATVLEQMEAWARKELAGEAFTAVERTAIAMVGGAVEHALITLADTDMLRDGDDDMAIVADVFTWQRRALEVGVAHPELVYAVIPTPEGWSVARGAVMGYRELWVAADERLTDEAWRERVGASKDVLAEHRPAWLAALVAAPVGPVGLPRDGQSQHRCEYDASGFRL